MSDSREENTGAIRVNGAIGGIEASIKLPFSKSILNRWLVINFLAKSEKRAEIPLVEIIDQYSPEDVLHLRDLLLEKNGNLFAGHGGTTARFGLAVKCLQDGVWQLSGTDRLNSRPIGILVDGLRKLGANIEYLKEEGRLPVKIYGGELVSEGPIAISGGVSSQFISALLLIAPYVKSGLCLQIQPPILSRTYIEMTLSLMRTANIKLEKEGNNILVFPGHYHPEAFVPERDWSAASYFLAALYLQGMGQLYFPGLCLNSIQGDAQIVDIFSDLGMEFREGEKGLEALLRPKEKVIPSCLELDFTHIPDMAQTFVLLCLREGLEGRFTGCDNLDLKETQRLQKLKALVELCGGEIVASGSGLLHFISPREIKLPQNQTLKTFADHRMAMSQALLACQGDTVEIEDAAVVGKSFPAFWSELENLGFLCRPA